MPPVHAVLALLAAVCYQHSPRTPPCVKVEQVCASNPGTNLVGRPGGDGRFTICCFAIHVALRYNDTSGDLRTFLGLYLLSVCLGSDETVYIYFMLRC